MYYIVVEVCSHYSNQLLNLYVVNTDNLIELHNYIKESLDIDNKFFIFDISGSFIESF